LLSLRTEIQDFSKKKGKLDFVVLPENIQIKNRLVYLPIYMLMFLQHEQNNDLTYQFDLTGLK
jgi:hypothetical protein